uniref:Tyrosine-protein kinase receptor n=1 Tax=Esox lucius TaxID=8010 RepID=A0A3P8XUN3_ESOLU
DWMAGLIDALSLGLLYCLLNDVNINLVCPHQGGGVVLRGMCICSLHSFPLASYLMLTAPSDTRCPGRRKSCDHLYTDENPDFTWSVVAAENPWEEGSKKIERKRASPQGWEEGQFFWVNSSVLAGPWVLSPWLWGGRERCGLDMSVFLHPQQSGRYTVWLIERDKHPLKLMSTDTLPRITGWAVVHLTLGPRGTEPFRIQASYDQPIEQDTTTAATIEPSFTTNCTVGKCRFGSRIICCVSGCIHVEPNDKSKIQCQFLNGSYCSFEDGECGWQPIAAKGSSWMRVHALPKGVRPSCPSSSGEYLRHSKGQLGSALLRSPLFPPPLRNSPCEVRFWMCSGGGQKGALSLWLVKNSTRPEEQQRMWQSASEPKAERGWRLISIPLYGLVDWFWLQFRTDHGPGPGSAICLDNISFSMDCFLASSKWAFHTCGAFGSEGPSPTQCSSSYRDSNVNVTVATRSPFKGIQIWRVPKTDTYRITACGAAGGRSVLTMTKSHGIQLTADFLLLKGELIYILVGQKGEDACPNVSTITKPLICVEQTPFDNKTQVKGGGGGGGGATYVFKVQRGVHIPLIIAAGGGGRGYSSQSESQEELIDSPDIMGRNGKSGAAGGGGGWNDSNPGYQGGRPLILGGQGGQPCQKLGWQTHGGFGGGGGACISGGGGGGYRGGSTSEANDPKQDGEDGSSFISPEGVIFLDPLKVMESDGEVIIGSVQNCSHCETGDCHRNGEETNCYCDDDLKLALDGVSCVNKSTELLTLRLGSFFISIDVSVLIILTFMLIHAVYRRKHTELQSIQLELQSPDCKLSKLRASTIMTDYNPNYCFAGKTASVNDLKEVPRRNISLTRGLGHGAFGEVYEGMAVGIPGEPSPMQVAVKTLPEVCSEQDELDFLMEALIISKFSHQNIVRCVGVSLQALPRFILLELMAGGDLKSFLRETRPRLEHPSSLSMVDLLNVARDIAQGCQYLEENQFIHRDIAARNCLLTTKGQGRVAKIGDFGMARDIYRASYYRKGGRAMLPVKWMPPEAFMEGIFTSKTDTWSFGVLLWEIFSLGYMPYPSRSNQEVLEFVTSGGRMDPPKNCPGPVYRIMTQSWQHQPEDRPNFSTILERIDYCLQDPDVVTVPLPVEYGPIPEEEEQVPMRPEDPAASPLLVSAQTPGEGSAPPTSATRPGEGDRQAEQPLLLPSGEPADNSKVLAMAVQPPQSYPQPQPHLQTFAPTVPASSLQPNPEGGHVNLAYTQGQPADKEGRNGKPTNLWNPTYGSWFLQQQRKQQQQQQQQKQGRVGGGMGSGRVPGEGQEHQGRTVAEAAGALGLQQQFQPPYPFPPQQQMQLQQIQLLQQQQQQQQGAAAAPLLLDSAALPPVPLFRLRRFPCGNIGYGYQEQGLPLELSLGRSTAGKSEDSRPLLVTMGTVQDPRLPRMEGHNATVL